MAYVLRCKSILTAISIKDSVSDNSVKADFEKKNIYLAVTIGPPEKGSNVSKVNWIIKYLEAGKKKNDKAFFKIAKKVFVSASIKYSRTPTTVSLADILQLKEIHKKDEIKDFKLYVVKDLGKSFVSVKGFVRNCEELLLDFYEGFVQHQVNWSRVAPKIERKVEGDVGDGGIL